jgi:hypothetical protein
VTENEGGKAQTAVCSETSDVNIACVAISLNKYILLQSGHHELQQSRFFSLSFACCFFLYSILHQISLPRLGEETPGRGGRASVEGEGGGNQFGKLHAHLFQALQQVVSCQSYA